jgi:hypothetical protein
VAINREDGSIAAFFVAVPLDSVRNAELAGMATEQARDARAFFHRLVLDGVAAGEVPADVPPQHVTNMVMALTAGLARFSTLTRTPTCTPRRRRSSSSSSAATSSPRLVAPGVGPPRLEADVRARCPLPRPPVGPADGSSAAPTAVRRRSLRARRAGVYDRNEPVGRFGAPLEVRRPEGRRGGT